MARPKAKKDTGKINIAILGELFPNDLEKTMLNKTIGCARKVYNLLLNDRQTHYKEYKASLKREVTYYYEEYPYLKEVDSLALANAKQNLDVAYTNFFEGRGKFPKPHKKGKNDSYTTNNQKGSIAIYKNYKELFGYLSSKKKLSKQEKTLLKKPVNRCNFIKLPKLGYMKASFNKEVEGKTIKSVTITKKANRYFISVLLEYDKPEIKSVDLKTTGLDKAIGFDYSSPYFYVDSNGLKSGYHKYYKQSERKLAKAQHRLSKKVKGSKNYYKQKDVVAKINLKIANQRKDFINKKVYELINSDYEIFCFEDLDLSALKKSLNLGKSTSDNGFGAFRSKLEQKCILNGKLLIKVDKWYPSTKTCSDCGYINKDITLSTKEWICPKCGKFHQRDINAAINIRNEGYKVALSA